MLEDMGNCVKIIDRLIPAVNIQTEGCLHYTHFDGKKEVYGVYFEVLFEDGTLWVVTKEGGWAIQVDIHRYWGFGDQSVQGRGIYPSWSSFLREYDSKLKRIGRVSSSLITI